MNEIRFIKAGVECDVCGRKFHQIDTDEERALTIVRTALEKHRLEAHRGDDQ